MTDQGPDARTKCLDLPVDAIVSGRRRLEASELSVSQMIPRFIETNSMPNLRSNSARSLDEKIVPGKGWQIFGEPRGLCDGTYNAVCGWARCNNWERVFWLDFDRVEIAYMALRVGANSHGRMNYGEQ
jgi:hypothetical protein